MSSLRIFPTFRVCASLFALPFLAVLSPAFGATTVFADRPAFSVATGPLSAESFEGLVATNTNPLTSISTTGFSITANGSYLGVYDRPETGAHATGGAKYVIAFNPAGGFIIDWTFTSPVNAVGFDISDFESGPASPLTFSYVGGSFSAAISTVNGSDEFFGLVDSSRTFTTFSLSSPSANIGDGVGFDRIAYGLAVPEPATYALCLAGLCAIGFAGRRRTLQRTTLLSHPAATARA